MIIDLNHSQLNDWIKTMIIGSQMSRFLCHHLGSIMVDHIHHHDLPWFTGSMFTMNHPWTDDHLRSWGAVSPTIAAACSSVSFRWSWYWVDGQQCLRMVQNGQTMLHHGWEWSTMLHIDYRLFIMSHNWWMIIDNDYFDIIILHNRFIMTGKGK